MNLKELIKKGETEKVEFKESLKLKDDIGRTVSSFSNCRGGVILIGVTNSRKIIGVSIGKNTIREFANYIKRNTDPQIYPSLRVEEIDEKKIIVLEVKESDDKPVFFKKYTYKRVGDSDHKLSSSEIRKLVKEEKKRLNWDEKVCKRATLNDIDEAKLRWFLETAKKKRKLTIPVDTSLMNALTSLDMIRDGKLTNAAVLLFGKNPQKFFLQSETKCVKMLTLKFVKPYDLYFGYEGVLFDQVDEAVTFVMENTRRPLVYGKGIKTERPEEFPEKVIREAIVNAIVHRDYSSPSKTQVRIFPDRIEFWNMGLLPEGLSIDDLKKPHRSLPRNPLLFKQFYRAGYVEDVGGGTVDIIEKCMAKGLPEPTYEEKQGGVVLTIWRDIFTPEYLRELDLNERQMKAVKYVKEHNRITKSEYADLFNCSERTALNDITILCEKNVFTRRGVGKATFYTLKKYTQNTRNTRNEKNRDIFTSDHLRELKLNERQIFAIEYIKEHGKITNKEHREQFDITRETSHKDLSDLVDKNIFIMVGKGPATYYTFKRLTISDENLTISDETKK